MLVQLVQLALCGHVLVLPGEYSHWYNMRVIVDELLERNHSVTVLVHTSSPTVKAGQQERFNFISFNISVPEREAEQLNQQLIALWTEQGQSGSERLARFWSVLQGMARYSGAVCDGLFTDSRLVTSLKAQRFDAMLFDPMMPCADLLAEALSLPRLMSIRLSLGFSLERLCGQMPAPPSYVPAAGVHNHLTDHMDFNQRLENVLLYAVQTVMLRLHMFLTSSQHYTSLLDKPTTICETIGRADIWLIRTYWDFEYPRPFLPNFQFVGGLHCKPAKPLPDEIEKFVQSSGDDGVVVFSLGSMIKNITKERANTIAEALGQIPQKVLWRYMGEKPETLAPNTRLYNWIPQNDLLGHPKTKAFISHGGTNGIYEAIYHGVPMVGLPMFADQPDNIMHMKTKGAAVMLDYNKMTTKDLKEAIDDVINNSSYKEGMMKLSRIHHDQLMTPLDRAVFWIEFVMRNKGAKHLRVAAHDLTWYQYYCLDVAVFLLSVIGLIIFLFVKTCKWLLHKCFKRNSKKSKKE